MLQYLQQNQANLTPQQQTIFQQLTHQYRLMQQHQQQLRLQQQQQRTQQPQVQVNNSLTVRPVAGQQFQGQPGFQQQQQQQTATRQPIQNGTVNQPGFDVDGSGNFPVATGHTQPAAGMPYKSANIQNAGFQSFQTQGFNTQANSSGNNQLDLGEFVF